MFTGLIEATGRLVERREMNGGVRLRIESPLAAQVAPGDSVAVNGVCLTSTVADPEALHADVGPETMRVTTFGALSVGSVVNLERPLRLGDRLGGHFVQGHVDAVGVIEDKRADAEFDWLTVSFPVTLSSYLVLKGSIALDGISLTVARLGRDRFDVMVVPYTLDHTNLSTAQPGDRVNLECDLVGKYVVRAAEVAGMLAPAGGGDVTR
jgi:riboflavin synthase